MTAQLDLGPMVEVRIVALPVAVWARTQQHTDELLREFTLLNEQMRRDADAAVPGRLLGLVDELTVAYSGFSGEQEAALFAAADAGTESLDLTYRVPAGVGAAAKHLGEMLNLADAYCRDGQHLLTLATPPELVRFREWFLAEFVNQVAGQPPVPWPAYAG